MSIEDTPYRKSRETYGEYVKRLEDIIYNWHDTHTTMLFKLKELRKEFPQKRWMSLPYNPDPEVDGGPEVYSEWEVEEWLAKLDVILVGTKQSQNNGGKRREL
jgi:hypothetical protein